MKHTLKIITLLTLGSLGATAFAQTPNPSQPVPQTGVVTSTGTKVEVPANQNSTNDYSNIGEGNAYEKAVTPLLREISRKKSILELKKLDNEIAKLDEAQKKDSSPSGTGGYVPMPTLQPAQAMRTTMPTEEMSNSTPVRVLMTYGDENDLYAKIAVGDEGGYTVRKGDILPDGRTVVSVSNNYIEVMKAKVKKSKYSKTEKIFVSAATPSNQSGNSSGLPGANGISTNSVSNYTPMPAPSSTMPTLMPIPAVNTSTATSAPIR